MHKCNRQRPGSSSFNIALGVDIWLNANTQAANFGIQNGAMLSRAQIRFFKHNDMADLEEVLKEKAAKDRRSK